MTTVALPALTAQIDQAVADFCAAVDRVVRELTGGFARLRGIFERAAEDVRRTLGLPPLAGHLRRLLWTGIARRHAEWPPTRGYWVDRCTCLACRERKGLA